MRYSDLSFRQRQLRPATKRGLNANLMVGAMGAHAVGVCRLSPRILHLHRGVRGWLRQAAHPARCTVRDSRVGVRVWVTASRPGSVLNMASSSRGKFSNSCPSRILNGNPLPDAFAFLLSTPYTWSVCVCVCII